MCIIIYVLIYKSQFNYITISIFSWKQLKYWANISESLLKCIAEWAGKEPIFRFPNEVEAGTSGDKEGPK